jgi:Skp family chaperone for outer membrane proteins
MKNTHVLDFDKSLKCYKQYQESIKFIRGKSEEFNQKAEEIKKEMEHIISQSKSFLLDETTKKQSMNRFSELQEKAMRLESDFRTQMTDLQNSELQKNFESLSEYISRFATQTGLELLLNKNSVLFAEKSLEKTDQFLEFMKKENIFSDEVLTEYQF